MVDDGILGNGDGGRGQRCSGAIVARYKYQTVSPTANMCQHTSPAPVYDAYAQSAHWCKAKVCMHIPSKLLDVSIGQLVQLIVWVLICDANVFLILSSCSC